MRRLVPVFVCFLAALAVAAGATYKVGDEVADATLSMADETTVKLSSHEGKAVLLFFYGTWERNARDDARQIEAVRKARAKQKLVVVGVARDAKPADAKKFAEDNKLGFAQAVDDKSQLYGRFASKGLPWIAVLDGKRKLKHSAAGIDEEAVETALTEILGAKDAAAAPK